MHNRSVSIHFNASTPQTTGTGFPVTETFIHDLKRKNAVTKTGNCEQHNNAELTRVLWLKLRCGLTKKKTTKSPVCIHVKM